MSATLSSSSKTSSSSYKSVLGSGRVAKVIFLHDSQSLSSTNIRMITPRIAFTESIKASPPKFSKAHKSVGTGPHLAKSLLGSNLGLFLP